VLIVDDNADSAEMVAMLVSIWGHDVRVAVDGEHALEVAREYAPEVILLDLSLPGIDGYEVARRLRSGGATSALLVALSGYDRPEDRVRSRAAGFDAHLGKPIEPGAVRSLIDGGAPARA
jgi:CheY-like chemotaxis protein